MKQLLIKNKRSAIYHVRDSYQVMIKQQTGLCSFTVWYITTDRQSAFNILMQKRQAITPA
jgi:hypothetical protein